MWGKLFKEMILVQQYITAKSLSVRSPVDTHTWRLSQKGLLQVPPLIWEIFERKLSKFLDPGEFEAENRQAVSIKMQKYVVTRILRESQEIVEHDREVEEESMPCAFHLLFVFGEIYSEGNETIGIRSSANCYGLSIGRVQWRN